MHAKQYIDTVMMNIQKQLGDEQTFPTKFGKSCSISSYTVMASIALCSCFVHYNTHTLTSLCL